MVEISKREHFYQQEYCGCVYSLRDTNEHRVAAGRERIRLGEMFYGVSASSESEDDGQDGKVAESGTRPG